MKFRFKMTLCMLAVLSLLFGAGGSLLISGFFQDSLEREKNAAFSSYRMAWSALQIVNGLTPYLDEEAIVQTMNQMCLQDSAAWTALRLSTADRVLFESETRYPFPQEGVLPEPGACLSRTVDGGGGQHWLLLSGAVRTTGETLYLQAATTSPASTPCARASSTPICGSSPSWRCCAPGRPTRCPGC